MKPLQLTPEIEAIAKRVIWFETPREAITDTARFLAYVMTYGDSSDVRILRKYLSADDFQEALEQAPPGIFDQRSWAYWNLRFGRYPTPPMPQRTFSGTSHAGQERN